MKEKIAKWYAQGLWTEVMVRNAVAKGILSEEEAAQILEVEKEGLLGRSHDRGEQAALDAGAGI